MQLHAFLQCFHIFHPNSEHRIFRPGDTGRARPKLRCSDSRTPKLRQVRQRPSSLGFVQLASAEAVRQAPDDVELDPLDRWSRWGVLGEKNSKVLKSRTYIIYTVLYIYIYIIYNYYVTIYITIINIIYYIILPARDIV